MFLRCILVVVCIQTSFAFMAEKLQCVALLHLSIHQVMDMGLFLSLAIVNTADNIHVHVFIWTEGFKYSYYLLLEQFFICLWMVFLSLCILSKLCSPLLEYNACLESGQDMRLNIAQSICNTSPCFLYLRSSPFPSWPSKSYTNTIVYTRYFIKLSLAFPAEHKFSFLLSSSTGLFSFMFLLSLPQSLAICCYIFCYMFCTQWFCFIKCRRNP